MLRGCVVRQTIHYVWGGAHQPRSGQTTLCVALPTLPIFVVLGLHHPLWYVDNLPMFEGVHPLLCWVQAAHHWLWGETAHCFSWANAAHFVGKHPTIVLTGHCHYVYGAKCLSCCVSQGSITQVL